jgi:hypothetical protein
MTVSAIARQRQKVEDQTKRLTPAGRCPGNLSPSRLKMMGRAFFVTYCSDAAKLRLMNKLDVFYGLMDLP